MPIRNQLRIVLAIALLSLACCSVKQSVNINGNTSPPPQKTTYWVVVMWTLIGTGYISEVCPLPVDDRESVAVAARAWGASHRGLMTVEDSVYSFTSQEEAEKFRREKKLIDVELNAEELKKYLCLGQPEQSPTEYWVIIMTSNDKELISEVFPLPAEAFERISAAANNWGYGKGFSTDAKRLHRFAKREEAEQFRLEKGLPELRLSLSSLQKYLCALRATVTDAATSSTPAKNENGAEPTKKSAPRQPTDKASP